MPETGIFIFLRAVNLGRRNKVPMKQLVAEIRSAGVGECSYLLQSGNLIFPERPADLAQHKDATERLIREVFDVETVAITRTPVELCELLDANPFAAPPEGSIHIAMWDETPDRAGLEALTSADYGEDSLCLTGREAIFRYANNSHSSKLSNALIERRLGVPSTARNIRTLERLLAL